MLLLQLDTVTISISPLADSQVLFFFMKNKQR